MVPNTYNHERLALHHRQALLREAEYERKLAELPQQHNGLARLIIGKAGGLLVALGSSMKQFERREKPVL
jgi:glucose/arabinose dehydrogenase